jgi:hypothetical protein
MAGGLAFALIREREDQEAAVLGRTFSWIFAFLHEREDQEAAIHGRTIQ